MRRRLALKVVSGLTLAGLGLSAYGEGSPQLQGGGNSLEPWALMGWRH